MPVYLPTSAVGNGRIACTLGGSGEIMTLFYPRLDFAENIEECLPLLYVGDPGHGRLRWTFDEAFARQQHYEPGTNIAVTKLQLADPAVSLTFTDFCPADTTALVRLVKVTNLSDHPFRGSFGHYFDLRLGEVYGKQAVGYDPVQGYFLQYFRGIGLAVGGTPFDRWRCGKSLGYDERSAKQDLEDGHLNGQLEDIGRVNFAGLRNLNLDPGQSDDFWMVLSAGPSREAASEQLARLRGTGPEKLLRQTRDYWGRWLGRGRRLRLAPELETAYTRALLSLALLQDANTGSIIAAPEFDPGYERCGGYGYCWPRDASEAAEAMAAAGYPEALSELCEWYKIAQLPTGLWGQRHWADGQVAASWALRPGFEQLDQTAAALLSVCNYVLQADQESRGARLASFWETIERAAQGLTPQISDDGLHNYACDLWETYCGVFVYTNAAFARALSAAADCARLGEWDSLARQWQETADRLREATKSLFNGHYFPRGLQRDGSIDDVVDSSTLGLVEPWRLLSPDNPAERKMILANLNEVERRLRQKVGERYGLRRFEGDMYLGGVVGCVNSLWIAQIYLRLAASQQADDPQAARAKRRRALEYIELCRAHATPAGLLPELIGLHADTPYWAVPHAWASALMVRCALLLDELADLA